MGTEKDRSTNIVNEKCEKYFTFMPTYMTSALGYISIRLRNVSCLPVYGRIVNCFAGALVLVIDKIFCAATQILTVFYAAHEQPVANYIQTKKNESLLAKNNLSQAPHRHAQYARA
jgi:hypothetical protein